MMCNIDRPKMYCFGQVTPTDSRSHQLKSASYDLMSSAINRREECDVACSRVWGMAVIKCGLEAIILYLDKSERCSSTSLAVICDLLLLFSVCFMLLLFWC